ncbi:beta-1,3-N-acetylglucosaminyltransferase, putative [Entamoeba dispar SAW760]|uniref:Hexosyltransferase n=1 Tax=Entamoeba dispar (strain ATCC PRA-260 / SAW760) TaxID=370354 RepID=B0EPW1_ENTDS|nr:beta-1,3-N-acetylglucosaminyltransferase, putative [Entamoeba dispar SAW760]EDR23430.1 beta-1,3-N-acetylglucosaminyltransferase, putative [Entamoeba dispar SAW760]|eukprot:EDR23430.1 beta-1,3-N-acetylglucosaminyltransferase, putative [Entamoeba dispar SAW760]
MFSLLIVQCYITLSFAQNNNKDVFIDHLQRRYVKSFYGEKFNVEESYPLRVNIEEYANLNQNVALGFEKEKTKSYPERLWLAIIHTMPNKISHIQNTRNTWCREEYQQRYGFKCIYVLVESSVRQTKHLNDLLKLNETYHDIYFIDMPDLNEHWFTLQQKNINAYIMALNIFPDYSFYSRVDDQILVTVDILSSFLMNHLTNSTVVGEMVKHRPNRNPRNKYYDPLAINIPKYFPFPAGYLSIFSQDIIKFIGKWENYYTFAPSSLEDPGFGHWIYKFANTTNQRVDLLTPENWGGNTKNTYGDYIIFHDQRGRLNQTEFLKRRIEDGYMKEF